MPFYTDEDMSAMTKEVDAIADLLRATDAILLREEKSDSHELGKNNVIYVDFAIAQEFKKLETTPTQMDKILKLYHDWAERVFLLAERNSGRHKKGKLRTHVVSALGIAATITRILPSEES